MSMNINLESKLLGVFTYNEYINSYERNDGKIHWKLRTVKESDNVYLLLKKAEDLFQGIDEFDEKAKIAIAEEFFGNEIERLLDYDENNMKLDSAVNENYMIRDKIIKLLTLHDVEIEEKGICCKYYGGDCFEGLIITAYFDNEYQLLSAEG